MAFSHKRDITFNPAETLETVRTSPAQEPPALRAVGLRNACLRAGVRGQLWLHRQCLGFILLRVVACSTSLISAQKGEKSLVTLLLLFPPNPLRWASAGALVVLRNAFKLGQISSDGAGPWPLRIAAQIASLAAQRGIILPSELPAVAG